MKRLRLLQKERWSNKCRKEIDTAFKIVAPVAAKCGVSEVDTRVVLKYLQDLSKAGVDGASAGIALRRTLIDIDKAKGVR